MSLVVFSTLIVAGATFYRNGDEDTTGRLIATACGAICGCFLGFMAMVAFGWIETSYNECVRTYSHATCTETLR